VRATWPVCKPVEPFGVELLELKATSQLLVLVAENRPNPASVLVHRLIMPGLRGFAGPG
jgi:hypothetical protein